MEALDEALAKKGGNGLISKPIVSKIKVNTAFFTKNAKPLHAFFINLNIIMPFLSILMYNKHVLLLLFNIKCITSLSKFELTKLSHIIQP